MGWVYRGGFLSRAERHALYSSEGKKAQNGAIVGWASPDIKVDVTGLSKIVISADVQTGKNGFGGGGGGRRSTSMTTWRSSPGPCSSSTRTCSRAARA